VLELSCQTKPNTFVDKRLIFVGVLFSVHFLMQVRIKIGKSAYSTNLLMVFIQRVGFVWRQLEFAFFGALTSVGALFYFS